ncbi:hypothetical protein LTR53_001154 [Teratosphaeriaceae sp. CCFEE 6253]|nr:hypothetical protein LTR53_001154 [Teratosphaeriaceae sp. CCFEE 6253]
MAACEHPALCFDLSLHADEAGFKRPSAAQRLAATRPSGRAPVVPRTGASSRETATNDDTEHAILDSTFPAPLVLPGDELSWDPKYGPQSFRSCAQLQARDAATPGRRTVYVVPPPEFAGDARFVNAWTHPRDLDTSFRPPSVSEVVPYLEAFYQGMQVKLLNSQLLFRKWDNGVRRKLATKVARREKATAIQNVALDTGSELFRIRARACEAFPARLNLNDLLDAAIRILPDDAYALLMLVHHDLFEDEEDDFCCGRAYGGSRVAVVSTARYNPLLDAQEELDRYHAWPAAHCKQYLDQCCAAARAQEPKKKRQKMSPIDNKPGETDGTAMGAALAAHLAHTRVMPGVKPPYNSLEDIWLGRVCKTASHELGHCFGMDHCVYYACVMQGTAGLREDARQPPYLCPVDTAKMLKTTGAKEQDWLRALLGFCRSVANDALFGAFAAWLEVRIGEVEMPTS